MESSIQNAPLVSIVVRTTAGRQEFLREALNSLKQQTFKNFEVLVVEDGGDNAASIVAAYNTADTPVFHHIPLKKVGRCLAGNKGLAAAKGQYLGFLDDDDQFFPEHIATLSTALTNNPLAPAVYALAEIRDTVIHSFSPLSYTEHAPEVPASAALPFFPTMLKANIMPIQAVLFRRSVYEKFGGFHADLDHFEDWDLWLRYAQEGGFVFVNAVTSFYRKPAHAKDIAKRVRAARKYLPLAQHASQDYVWQLPLNTLRHSGTPPWAFALKTLKERVYLFLFSHTLCVQLHRRIKKNLHKK